MAIKKSKPQVAFDVFNYIFLALLSLICLYPMLYALFASLSDPIAFSKARGAIWWPQGFNLNGYVLVFQNPNIGIGYKNTLIYVVAHTAVSMLLTTFGAYGFSRKGMLLQKPLFLIVAFTMYFSGGLIPTFLNVKNLGMLDTRWAIILNEAVSVYNMIVLRTGFTAVPDSLEESAKIDGANDFITLFRIILPLALPSFMVVMMYYAVAEWNNWFTAMVYLRKTDLLPLQTFMREILVTGDLQGMAETSSSGDGEFSLIYESYSIVKYCTIIVATLPVLVIYPFIQRFFIKGVMIGAVKG